MKKIIIALSSFFFINNLHAQATNPCERITQFGKASICLPVIEGMKECYLDSAIKPMADGTEFEGNIVLGYYLTNENYKERNNPESQGLDNYFKLYSSAKLNNYKASLKDLQEITAASEAQMKPKNWEELKKQVEKKMDGLAVGVPVLIDKYSLAKNSNTLIIMAKYGTEKESYILVMSFNMLLIKDRIVDLGYYKVYESEADINTCKEKSNSIVLAFINANR